MNIELTNRFNHVQSNLANLRAWFEKSLQEQLAAKDMEQAGLTGELAGANATIADLRDKIARTLVGRTYSALEHDLETMQQQLAEGDAVIADLRNLLATADGRGNEWESLADERKTEILRLQKKLAAKRKWLDVIKEAKAVLAKAD